MTLPCVPVDADAGIVLRLAAHAECMSLAIGAAGFQRVIGGPVSAGLLSAAITIFVAIIGYRFVLGTPPGCGEGVGRTLRLGLVLSLVTGWPAFQALVYDIATAAPEELAATILPGAGLTPSGLPERVQQVYDALRLGADGDPGAAGPPQPTVPSSSGGRPPTINPQDTPQLARQGQPGLDALPQTASVYAVATIGTIAAQHLAVGILLAVAPLALLALLFDGTLGLFNGWLRALVGTVLAGLAATIVTAVSLIPIEQEVVRQQGWRAGRVLASIDPHALPTLVLASALAMLVATLAAGRMGGALRYLPGSGARVATRVERNSQGAPAIPAASDVPSGRARAAAMLERDRAAGVADALAVSVRREQRAGDASGGAIAGGRAGPSGVDRADRGGAMAPGPATANRRTALRRSRLAANRDRVGR